MWFSICLCAFGIICLLIERFKHDKCKALYCWRVDLLERNLLLDKNNWKVHCFRKRFLFILADTLILEASLQSLSFRLNRNIDSHYFSRLFQVFDFIGGGELFSYLRKVKQFDSNTGETFECFSSNFKLIKTHFELQRIFTRVRSF